MAFGDRVINFNTHLDYSGPLPPGIQIMNPFRENPAVIHIIREFYGRFYNDDNPRYMILGINPGRFGGGVTGIPFTDTKRLNEKCGIVINEFQTHEPSSAFVYDVIEAYGGVNAFYSKFYIGAVSPLGFTTRGKKGNTVNYNYYDDRDLTRAVSDFILESLRKQFDFGIERDVCFCLGTGKNEQFLSRLNDEYRFFNRIIALEHPRFIMQYRARSKQDYIRKYISAFHLTVNPKPA